MSLRPLTVTIAVLLAAGACLAQPADKGVSEEKVQAAIAKAAAYLYSVANAEGVWDPPKEPNFRVILAGSIGGDLLACNWPGQSALVLNALAEAGEQQDPRFKKALAWVMKQNMVGTCSSTSSGTPATGTTASATCAC